ncbi:MAG: hypothetical protein ACI9DC_002157 [Gammaproteobacteria bacterium]|jgi:hypothetical protein
MNQRQGLGNSPIAQRRQEAICVIDFAEILLQKLKEKDLAETVNDWAMTGKRLFDLCIEQRDCHPDRVVMLVD